MEAARWFKTVVTKHYNDFDGRARRAEFWWYMLVFVVIDVALALVQLPTHTKILTALLGLGLFVPTVGVYVRRLHDIGKSGWWLLVGLVPVIGIGVVLYWWAQPGTSGPNEFGPDPKASPVGPADAART
jgi:uncharacterized membrane protein YhaH (DUF805 family)